MSQGMPDAPARCFGDYHVHTAFCDGAETPAEVAAHAAACGMTRLGFSSHAPLPVPCDWCMTPERTPQYRAEIRALADAYREKLEILCGTEADPDTPEDLALYDYVIASVHTLCVGGARRPIDESPAESRKTVTEYFGGDGYAYAAAYFEAVAQLPRAIRCDIIGHFDLVAKFNETDRLFDESDRRYLTPATDALAALAPCGALLELNSGAIYRRRRSVPYPILPLLREWRRLGGQVILSSDAHTKAALSFRFDEMVSLAREAGYKEAASLTHGAVEFRPL